MISRLLCFGGVLFLFGCVGAVHHPATPPVVEVVPGLPKTVSQGSGSKTVSKNVGKSEAVDLGKRERFSKKVSAQGVKVGSRDYSCVIKEFGKGWQRRYEVNGRSYMPMKDCRGYVRHGIASWYGREFHGRPTSNGETYDMYAMTAAHKTLPLGIIVKVTNKVNGKSILVRVNDRGPFVKGRIIDLSYSAAKKLEMDEKGTAPVKVEALGYPVRKAKKAVAKRVRKASVKPAVRKVVATKAVVAPKKGFVVQVGSFSQKEIAGQVEATLKKKFASVFIEPATVNGKEYFRVRVGGFVGRTGAEAAKVQLSEFGYPGTAILAQ